MCQVRPGSASSSGASRSASYPKRAAIALDGESVGFEKMSPRDAAESQKGDIPLVPCVTR